MYSKQIPGQCLDVFPIGQHILLYNLYIIHILFVQKYTNLFVSHLLANELSDGFVERTRAPVQTIDEICWTRTADQRPQRRCRWKTNKTQISRVINLNCTTIIARTVNNIEYYLFIMSRREKLNTELR